MTGPPSSPRPLSLSPPRLCWRLRLVASAQTDRHVQLHAPYANSYYRKSALRAHIRPVRPPSARCSISAPPISYAEVDPPVDDRHHSRSSRAHMPDRKADQHHEAAGGTRSKTSSPTQVSDHQDGPSTGSITNQEIAGRRDRRASVSRAQWCHYGNRYCVSVAG